MELKAEVRLTPEEVANSIWQLNSEEQAEMLKHLHDIAGSEHVLMTQFLYVRDDCERRNDESLGAFQSMFASAFKYMWS